MPAARFALSLDADQKARLFHYAEANGVSAAAVIKAIIDRLPAPASEPPESAGGPNTAKVTVRLPDRALASLDQQIEDAGFLNRTAYARSLLLHALEGEPPLAEPELQALRDNRRELAAIGRNLNQIARSLHIDDDSSGPEAELLQQAIDQVDVEKRAVRALIRTAEQRGSS